MIKMTARKRELEQRLAVANQNFENSKLEATFLRGAIDDLIYMMNTWAQPRITAINVQAPAHETTAELIPLRSTGGS